MAKIYYVNTEAQEIIEKLKKPGQTISGVIMEYLGPKVKNGQK